MGQRMSIRPRCPIKRVQKEEEFCGAGHTPENWKTNAELKKK